MPLKILVIKSKCDTMTKQCRQSQCKSCSILHMSLLVCDKTRKSAIRSHKDLIREFGLIYGENYRVLEQICVCMIVTKDLHTPTLHDIIL